jgi:small-conductance mechanosensitive channel
VRTTPPYALESGAAQSPAELAAALNQHFTNLESVAAQAHLSDHCRQKIAKAKRMLVAMVATLTFYVLTLRAKVEALALPPAMERAVYDQLIPAIYLDLVAEKTAAAAQRHTLKQRAAELLAPLCGASSPLKSLAPEDLRVIEQVAQECAELFQRSSSCVEGRNGQLALRHHSLHRLRDQKLAALTTMHNYFVQRSDGTTAAERFFGAKPGNLFEWVLERVDLPGWPAQKRAAPKPKEYLAPAAAGA